VVAQQPERFFVAEILREKIFLQYSQEVPYCTAVRCSEHRLVLSACDVDTV